MRRRRRRYDNHGWGRYVPVAERRRDAAREVTRMREAGKRVLPVVIESRKIARTFWGQAWCRNLEAYSDFANRLPRGRTYVRNGSVIDLQLEAGRVKALVSGSEIYQVLIAVSPLAATRWHAIKSDCSGRIESLVELLQGSLSSGVMEVVTRKGTGLFPAPGELSLKCSCLDFASMCKHVAATLYGVGARLDDAPELLFELRGVDPGEMVEAAADQPPAGMSAPADGLLAEADLSSVFGIDFDLGEVAPAAARPHQRRKRKQRQERAGSKQTSKSPPVDLLDSPVSALGLPSGALSRLTRATGVKTVGQLAALEPHHLLSRPGVGRKTLHEIRTALAAHSLSLGMSTA